jgi:hypothetical protein
MRCPFRYRRRDVRRFSFGVSGEFLDFLSEGEGRAEQSFNEQFPTCWKQFLHWLGII